MPGVGRDRPPLSLTHGISGNLGRSRGQIKVNGSFLYIVLLCRILLVVIVIAVEKDLCCMLAM